MDFGFVLSKLFVLFFAIAAAFIAAKCDLFPKGTVEGLSKAVVYILNPMLMLTSALNNSHILTNAEVFSLTGIACLCYAFLILTAKVVARLLHLPRQTGRLYEFMFIFSNIGFFGMPLINSLFGADAVFLVSMYMLPFQCLTFTYGITLVAGDQEHQKFSLKMFLHPMILSTLLSYVIYLTNLRVPAFVNDGISFLNGAASPMAMIVVGMTLASASLKDVFGNWRLYVLLALKMVLVPVLVLFILRWLLPDTESNRLIIAVSTTVMAMPTAANTTILATQYRGDAETASCGVFLATAASAITIPFLMTLL